MTRSMRATRRRRGRPGRVSGVALMLALAVAGARASPASDDLAGLSLDDLLRVEVAGASRYVQPLSETPGAVTVISRDELRQHGHATLAGALASVRGLYLGSDRNYTYLGVRGISPPGDYNSRILLLTDGTRRNDALFDQALLGHEAPIDLDWVKRLEFVAGPASAVYGSNALFGIVHAVMLDGGDVDGVRVHADAGSGRGARTGFTAGQRLDGDREWFVGVAAGERRGEDLFFPEYAALAHRGVARGLDSESYRKLYARYRTGGWRVTLNLSGRDKAVPTAAYGTQFGEPGTRTLDQHALFEIAHETRLGADWQQHVRASVADYRYNGDYRYADDLANRDEARARWWSGDYRLTWSGLPRHRLQIGAELQRNVRLLQRNHDLTPAATWLDSDRPSHTLGVFVQDEWRFHPQWMLNAGVRHDRHSDYAGVTSPRLALVFQPRPTIALKAIHGSAYRAPNAYERFYDDGGMVQKANPSVRPERMRSHELVGEFQVGNGGRVGLSAYRNTVRDLIAQRTDPADGLLVFRNLDRVHARGLELELERRWTDGRRLRASLAVQRTRDEVGELLVNSPRRMFSLLGAHPLAPGVVLAGEWQALSARRSLGGHVAGGGWLNLSLGVRLPGRGGDLQFAVFNLGDRRLREPVSSVHAPLDTIAGDGRQWRLRWTLAF